MMRDSDDDDDDYGIAFVASIMTMAATISVVSFGRKSNSAENSMHIVKFKVRSYNIIQIIIKLHNMVIVHASQLKKNITPSK